MNSHSLSTDVKQTTSDRRSMLSEIYEPVAEALQRVQRMLVSELDPELPWLDELAEHSGLSGGKRLRPALALLTGATIDEISEPHVVFATALEMIHTASLVHDDVLDHASMRRHRSTINHRFGNKASVLFGDYLFTHAFFLATRTSSIPVLRRLSLASNRVCEGELKQNAWAGNFEITEAQYLTMIREKTAELCACACFGGAWLAGAEPRLCEAFEQFGEKLGIAFQIIDDVLDLVGETETVGKTLGTDLAGQKVTLPLIHCLKTMPEQQRTELVRKLEAGAVDPPAILSLLSEFGSIDYARDVARSHAKSAVAFVTTLTDSPACRSLRQIAEFVLARTY